MPVDIAIKGLPDALVEALRRRASEHNRSLDEEVIATLEAALPKVGTLTAGEFLAEVRASGPGSASESVAIIREDRDTDHGRSRPEAEDE